MYRFLILLFLHSAYGFSQQIKIEYDCDTTEFKELNKEDYLIENTPCRLTKTPFALYFTSWKEFSNYYNKYDLQVYGPCLSSFNNFNFKKYNMVLICLDYEKSTTKSITADVRYKDYCFNILVRKIVFLNSINLLLPEYFYKCISLPKEKSLNKPKLFYVANSEN